MPNIRITAKLAAVVLGVALLAGTAYAGPQVKFGPKDEGLLQLDYKGQLQMTMRDNGSGLNIDLLSADRAEGFVPPRIKRLAQTLERSDPM